MAIFTEVFAIRNDVLNVEWYEMKFDGKKKEKWYFQLWLRGSVVMLIFFFIAIRKRTRRVRARTPAPAFNSMTFVYTVPFLFSLRSFHITIFFCAFLLRLYFYLLLVLIHSLTFYSIANFLSRLIQLGGYMDTYILYLMGREFILRIGCTSISRWCVKKFDVMILEKYAHHIFGELTKPFVCYFCCFFLTLSLAILVSFPRYPSLLDYVNGARNEDSRNFLLIASQQIALVGKWNEFWISNNYRRCQLCIQLNKLESVDSSFVCVRVCFFFFFVLLCIRHLFKSAFYSRCAIAFQHTNTLLHKICKLILI